MNLIHRVSRGVLFVGIALFISPIVPPTYAINFPNKTPTPTPTPLQAVTLCIRQNGLVFAVGQGFHTILCTKNDKLITVQVGGSSGVNGQTGNTGATGVVGPTGSTGTQGLIGQTGPTGMPGTAGETGVQGTTGDKGPTGDTGLQGSQGLIGPVGSTGEKGAPGSTGPTGLQGLLGFQGATGDKGQTGDTGLPGSTGPTGLAGIQGGTGTIGPTGEKGPTGDAGGQGSTGATGLQGATGVIGGIFLGGNGDPDSTTSKIGGAGLFSFYAISSEADKQVPVVGTLTNLRAVVSTAPGSGKSWIITVRKNKTDTTSTCTITESAKFCSDSFHAVSFALGDLFTIKIDPSASPSGAGNLAWSVIVQ